MRKDAPSNAGELVGERDGEDVVMQPFLGRLEPDISGSGQSIGSAMGSSRGRRP